MRLLPLSGFSKYFPLCFYFWTCYGLGADCIIPIDERSADRRPADPVSIDHRWIDDPAALRPSPGRSNLHSLIYTETGDISDGIMDVYFRGNAQSIRTILRPYICKHIDDITVVERMDLQSELELSSSNSSDRISEKIADLVAQAVEEALKDERKKSIDLEERVSERITKTKVALIAAVTTISSALITAGVTIAVTFNT